MKGLLAQRKLFTWVLYLLISDIFIGCGAVSTSGRYETRETAKDKTEPKTLKSEDELNQYEQFDLTPYRPVIVLEDTKFITNGTSENYDAWYEYKENSESTKNRKIVGTEDGFRVQLIATDDLNEANRVNAEINSLIPNQRSYVNFEPPFYKVKLGDFRDNNDANNMRFRLSQMGYSESKVVRETINIFE